MLVIYFLAPRLFPDYNFPDRHLGSHRASKVEADICTRLQYLLTADSLT